MYSYLLEYKFYCYVKATLNNRTFSSQYIEMSLYLFRGIVWTNIKTYTRLTGDSYEA